ncbi:MAG TPA: FHA domain-containing protein [Gemmatimonadaceae bacterium]|nr:FHA domain-containing protein [Gemmatimonadaceae bacterium]
MRSLLFAARRRALGAELALLDEHGAVKQRLTMESSTLTIGRDGCDLVFPDDPYVSPIHAQLAVRDGALFVRDLGSTNHTWVFLDAPHHLLDDDLLLIGSQLIRFESIGTPAIVEPDVDPARRFGSHVPGTDVARLLQLRSDGSVRDAQYLVLGRTRSIGRDTGDWTFPYDQTMSGRHAEIHEHDGRFTLHDLGSRNGVAVAVRGELSLAAGQRLMVGDQVLRVERV